MAINLKNEKAERLLKALAEATGESLTEAATRAFEDRLAGLTRDDQRPVERRRALLGSLYADARRHRPRRDPGDKAVTDELWGDAP